mgnify:FL=1
MVQTITKEWQITKMYIYEVVLRDGVISLDWDDFETFAEKNRPMVAIRNEGDIPVKELVKEAMDKVQKYCSTKPSSIIISISYKKGDEIKMDEMFGLSDSMDEITSENVEIKWGISQGESLESKRSVCIFIFG